MSENKEHLAEDNLTPASSIFDTWCAIRFYGASKNAGSDLHAISLWFGLAPGSSHPMRRKFPLQNISNQHKMGELKYYP